MRSSHGGPGPRRRRKDGPREASRRRSLRARRAAAASPRVAQAREGLKPFAQRDDQLGLVVLVAIAALRRIHGTPAASSRRKPDSACVREGCTWIESGEPAASSLSRKGRGGRTPCASPSWASQRSACVPSRRRRPRATRRGRRTTPPPREHLRERGPRAGREGSSSPTRSRAGHWRGGAAWNQRRARRTATLSRDGRAHAASRRAASLASSSREDGSSALRAWCALAVFAALVGPGWTLVLGPVGAAVLFGAIGVVTVVAWMSLRPRIDVQRLPWIALAFLAWSALSVAGATDPASAAWQWGALALTTVQALFVASALTWAELVRTFSTALCAASSASPWPRSSHAPSGAAATSSRSGACVASSRRRNNWAPWPCSPSSSSRSGSSRGCAGAPSPRCVDRGGGLPALRAGSAMAFVATARWRSFSRPSCSCGRRDGPVSGPATTSLCGWWGRSEPSCSDCGATGSVFPSSRNSVWVAVGRPRESSASCSSPRCTSRSCGGPGSSRSIAPDGTFRADRPYTSLTLLPTLTGTILLVEGLADASPLLRGAWLAIVLLGFKLGQAPLVGVGPADSAPRSSAGMISRRAPDGEGLA